VITLMPGTSVPLTELLELIAALLAAGMLGGFLSGLLGIGGGGIIVPVLYEVFGVVGVPEDVRMHLTLGTTLAVIAPTALTSATAHWRRGSLDAAVVRQMAPAIVAGVVIGVLVAKDSSSAALRWVWVVAGSLLALKMFIGRDDWRLGDKLPGPPWIQLAGGTIGFISTLMGIGGATFTVPLLTLYGRPMLQAVGTASGIGPVIAVTGIIGYVLAGWGAAGLPPLSLGFVSAGAALIIPVSVLAAPLGVRTAHGVSKRKLEVAFGIFISVVVGRFLISLLS
jgi:uncharacterized membrane protein YfcA